MSRPSPQSEPTDLARTLREACAHMLEDAADAGRLAPLYLLIARAIAALFGRLANLAELWRAGALPPLPSRAYTPRRGSRPRHARPNRPRRAPRARAVIRVLVRARFALQRAGLAHRPARRSTRPVERYPKC